MTSPVGPETLPERPAEQHPPHTLPDEHAAPARVALVGNPNTGKTTLFNRLCGLRHKTSNFPGTTQEARIGSLQSHGLAIELIDLPGVYSLELEQQEAEVCRGVLAGSLSPRGERVGQPDALLVVADATNLARGLALVGEAMAQRLPMVVALNMSDLARRAGMTPDRKVLEESLGCEVIPVSARTGEGLEPLAASLAAARIPNRTPPGGRENLERWSDDLSALAMAHQANAPGRGAGVSMTDRLDRVFTHGLAGTLVFALVMSALFWVIFQLATYPMDWIDSFFGLASAWVESVMPAGLLRDLLSQGVVSGIGATVVFLPQICLLFFLISLLEDTGYLARAAFLMDRLLRPFGMPGHSFVPLLSSHACALPGIMATRAIPDRRERLATILVAPFMTCSARIPVYVLLIGILFKDRPAMGALAFVGCYALGILAGLLSALIARRTILKGAARPMVLELPTYKFPSLRTALLTTYDRGWVFLKNAGTNILAICIVLWWMGSFPKVQPPPEAVALHQQVVDAVHGAYSKTEPAELLAKIEGWQAEAARLEASHAKAESYAGRLGRFVQPAFAPLGLDWQLTVGVLTSFAAREVFVSTMAVIVTGEEDAEDAGVVSAVASARRSDGVTPVFTRATSWAVLVFYVLAMQCLPTLAVTAKEAGGARWAFLQLAWMSIVAYLAGALAFAIAS